MKNIQDVMFPNNGELIIKGEEITSIIVDEELDPIKCSFNNDNCVELNTKKYNSIVLSIQNLYELIELIEQAKEQYEKILDNDNEN